jgi:hypothetical protein
MTPHDVMTLRSRTLNIGVKQLMGNHDRYFLTAETMQETNLIRIL